MLESFNIVKHKSSPASRGQLRNRPLEIDAADGGWHEGSSRYRLVRPFLVQRPCRPGHLRLAAAQEIEALVHRQPVEPGAQGRIATEAAQLAVRSQEDFLKQV